MYNQYITRNVDYIKLKNILNVYYNMVLRRICVLERERK